MNKDYGGSAFPITSHGGMYLRDYFAAAALQGLCANSALCDALPNDGNVDRWIAEHATKLADAMLAERAK